MSQFVRVASNSCSGKSPEQVLSTQSVSPARMNLPEVDEGPSGNPKTPQTGRIYRTETDTHLPTDSRSLEGGWWVPVAMAIITRMEMCGE
jgi:hypothetical protein